MANLHEQNKGWVWWSHLLYSWIIRIAVQSTVSTQISAVLGTELYCTRENLGKKRIETNELSGWLWCGSWLHQYLVMANDKIPCIQITLHRSKDPSVLLAKAIAPWHTGICLIQEPWVAGGLIKGPIARRRISWSPCYSKPRECIM